jgi:hypothetical protein
MTFLLTVTWQEARFPPADAVTEAVPSATPVTVPSELTVATPGLDEFHDTVLSVASEGLTVASNFPVAPISRDNVTGLILTFDTGFSVSGFVQDPAAKGSTSIAQRRLRRPKHFITLISNTKKLIIFQTV